MKKLLLSAAAFFIASQGFSQQFQLDLINFDSPPAPVTNGSVNTTVPNQQWFVNSTFPNGDPSNTSGPNCYRDTVPQGPAGAYSYFYTNSYNCSSNGYVSFQFNHICKIPGAQRGQIEVSVNGAAGPWVTLNGTHYKSQFYHANSFSAFFTANGYFSSGSYPTAWFPAQPTRVPDSTWWRNEVFDVSAIAAFQGDVRFRFKLTNFDGTGHAGGNYGWLIDDIDIQVAASVPPVVNLIQTNAGSITLGPFNFVFQIPNTGSGCCNSVFMNYSINGNPHVVLPLINTATDLWTCTIPAQSDSDVICYYIQAQDWGFSEGYYPSHYLPYVSAADPFNIPGTTKCFVAAAGIHFPYIEKFDLGDGGWYVDSSLNLGSYWQWGIPNVGVTAGPYSFPYCWDVDLHAKYVANTHTYLYTPLFSLTNTTNNIKLTFWRNHYVQPGRDGFRMEYSFGGGPWTRLGDEGDPKGTNWYDTTIAGSNYAAHPFTEPGWSGNTGAIWRKSEYFLQQFIGLTGTLQFRYVFDSDNFGNIDGVSIDDFSLVVPPAKDAEMIAIIKPGSSAPAGDSDSVRVMVRNVGSLTIHNLPVKYSVNGGPAVSGVLSPADSIEPAAFKVFSFPTMYVIPSSAYNICAWTDLGLDADRSNDSLCKPSVGVSQVSLPFKDNFDGTQIWYDSTDVTSLSKWELGSPNYGVTNSAYSSPNAWDVNLNTQYFPSSSTLLLSPLFDFTNAHDVTLRFWQNRKLNEGEDGMRLEYSTSAGGANGTDWHIVDLDSLTSDSLFFDSQNWYTDETIEASGKPAWSANSFGWKESKIVMRGLDTSGASVQFRFIFSSYSVMNAPLDGISVDNFSVKAISPRDAGVLEVVYPIIKDVAGDSDSVVVIIKNYGDSMLTSCPLRYRINGGAFTSPVETWTGALNTYETDTFYFVNKFVAPGSYYDICAYTVIGNDGDRDNDTSCNRPFGLPRKSITFSDDFENPPQNWLGVAIDNVTQWELGMPAYGVTDTTHSGFTAWDVNLSTDYKKNGRTELYSPVFNFTNQYNARLSFWHNWSTQSRRDGVVLQYKTRLTDTVWTSLDTLGNLFVKNWYNDSATYVPLRWRAWSGQSAAVPGNSQGWLESKMMMTKLDNTGPDVQFRFLFVSDDNFNGNGYTMDDFTITRAPDADIAAFDILNPRQVAIAGNSEPLNVLIYNAGNLPITSLSLNYSINGVTQTPTPWTGNILPGDSLYLTVGNMIVPHLEYTLCFWPVVTNDGDHSNDTVCIERFGAAQFNITYFDSLNAIPQEFFKLEDDNEWEHGSPLSTTIYYACSPPYCWKTKIAGQYSQSRNDYLYSPFFLFSGAYKAELRFCLSHNSEPTNDGLRVDYSLDTGKTWLTLGASGDGLGTNWYTTNTLNTTNKPAWEGNSQGWKNAAYKLDILSYYPGVVQFRFHFASSIAGSNDGFAIDNFEIYNPFRYNLTPVWIDPLPSPFQMTGNQLIKAYIKNSGSLDLDTFTVSLYNDGVLLVTDMVDLVTPLPYLGQTSHTFSVPWNPTSPTPGGHDMCVITSLPNNMIDQYKNDDTLCTIVGNFDSVAVNNSNPQYCNDFDGTATKWIPLNTYPKPGPIYSTTGSIWRFGMPEKTTINSTYSGDVAWATRLKGLYDPIDSSGLLTPVFQVDSDGCYELSFYHNFQMEDFQDGGVVEYSLDAGQTWHMVGYGFEQNWYNSVFITSLSRDPNIPGLAGWTGSSFGGWVYAAHNVKFYNPAHAVFRFRFGSDPSLQMEGWAIDNFCLKKIGPCTIGLEELDGNNLAMSQNFPNPANGKTSISYFLPTPGQVRMYVTNLLGQEIQSLVDELQMPGQHMLQADVSMLSNGVYYYTLEFEGKRLVGKMVIAK